MALTLQQKLAIVSVSGIVIALWLKFQGDLTGGLIVLGISLVVGYFAFWK